MLPQIPQIIADNKAVSMISKHQRNLREIKYTPVDSIKKSEALKCPLFFY